MVESLLCDATTCVYNASRKCTAKSINVVGGTTRSGSDTYCATFSEDQDEKLDANPYIQDLETSAFDMTPGVACNAVNCTYNDSNKCYASGVKILDQRQTAKGSTECNTFRPE